MAYAQQAPSDLGYLAHCLLARCLGDQAPTPFWIERDRGRRVSLLAYGNVPIERLSRSAEEFADPADHQAVDWSNLSQKRMSAAWRAGRRLGFRLRACPVVRLGRETREHRKGAEVDAFLARAFAEPGVALRRDEVYTDWLRAQLERRGGARLMLSAVRAFRRVRLVRRTHAEGRRARLVERPDVLFEGELEITDGKTFSELLQRGIGRHRAFGFGMLLLNRPRIEPC